MAMISLLTTDPNIANWFQDAYPSVQVCNSVTEDFYEADCIILTELYRIENQYYEAQSLWEYSLSIEESHKKLITLGWSLPSKGNYLGVSDMPDNIEVFIQEALPLSQLQHENYCYSTAKRPPKDKAIGESIDKYLKSHSSNNLQDLLMQGKDKYGDFEELLDEGENLHSLLQGKPGEEIREVYLRLEKLWKKVLPFLELIPQFPIIQQFNGLQKRMHSLLEGNHCHEEENEIPISLDIVQFLDEKLTFITAHYQFD